MTGISHIICNFAKISDINILSTITKHKILYNYVSKVIIFI